MLDARILHGLAHVDAVYGDLNADCSPWTMLAFSISTPAGT